MEGCNERYALGDDVRTRPHDACQRGEGGGGLVARAAGHDLTVVAVTTLLAPATMLPDQPEVVMAVADLWIDYTLLAEIASADSTMLNLDVDALLRQQEEAEMIGALRDSVVRPDTAISDEEVQRRFALEAPGSRVRARHILLAPPANSTLRSVTACAGQPRLSLTA